MSTADVRSKGTWATLGEGDVVVARYEDTTRVAGWVMFGITSALSAALLGVALSPERSERVGRTTLLVDSFAAFVIGGALSLPLIYSPPETVLSLRRSPAP